MNSCARYSSTPSELSLIAHFLGVTEFFLYADQYLNPVRELDPLMGVIGPLLQEGFPVLILGADVPLLLGRIRSPGSYWATWKAQAKIGEHKTPPRVCLVMIPMMPQENPSMELGFFQGCLNVLFQQNRGERLEGRSNEQQAALQSTETSVLLEACQLRPYNQRSKFMCSVGSYTFEADWTKLYGEQVASFSALPYIDATDNPSTVKVSLNDSAMKFRVDTHNNRQSIVLWSRKYPVPPNALFTGGALDDHGRDVLDEVKVAFEFPCAKRSVPSNQPHV